MDELVRKGDTGWVVLIVALVAGRQSAGNRKLHFLTGNLVAYALIKHAGYCAVITNDCIDIRLEPLG